MISAFTNTWKIPELRDRILFTLALIVIIRLGVHITLPGVDGTVITAWLDDLQKQDPTNPTGGITALLTVFSGGGLQQAGILALAMRHGVVPPTINYTTRDPECDLDYTPNTAREKRLSVALSNSFGFGGTNASLLMRLA